MANLGGPIIKRKNPILCTLKTLIQYSLTTV